MIRIALQKLGTLTSYSQALVLPVGSGRDQDIPVIYKNRGAVVTVPRPPVIYHSLLYLNEGPIPSPVLNVGSAAESTYSTPSHVGRGAGISFTWPGRSRSHRSSMEWSSCWVLWQCSTKVPANSRKCMAISTLSRLSGSGPILNISFLAHFSHSGGAIPPRLSKTASSKW